MSQLERTPVITAFMQRTENGGENAEFLSTFPGDDQDSYHHSADSDGLGILCMSWQQLLTLHYECVVCVTKENSEVREVM